MEPSRPDRRLAGVVLALLALSIALLLAAPTLLDDSYSPVEHTTSESGAQHTDGAWAARAGFVAFGLGVLGTAAVARRRWALPGTVLHATFACCMFGVALFSARSWIDEVSYDSGEDALHSLFATVMGFAFTFGVLAVAIQRARRQLPWRKLDVLAIVAATVLPIGMATVPGIAGLLQRTMFAVAFAWYGSEALRRA